MIYIDLDNTLFDFTSAYFAGFKRKYGVSLPKETFTRYDFYNHPVFINLMADLGRWDYKAAAFAVWEEGHFFRDLALFEGAKEAVERLCSLGVCFVTDHVSEGCEKDKREAIKREFGELKVMKGGGGDVILLMLTRIGRVNMFCERDFLIDDNPFVLEGGDRSKIFIFDNVYNRGIHCKRINGWGEVRNLVEQEYYINPVRAKKYADCGSVEGILGLRKKMWEQESRNNWESTLRLWREI